MSDNKELGLKLIGNALNEAASIIATGADISLLHKKAIESTMAYSITLGLSGMKNERFEKEPPLRFNSIYVTILKYSGGAMDLLVSMMGYTFKFENLPFRPGLESVEEYCTVERNPILRTL